MTRRDKGKSELISETAPGPSELTRQFADDPGHVPAGKLLDELAAEHERERELQAARETLLAPYEGSVPGPPEGDLIPRPWLEENRQAKPVYEQCPDKGTCHHACILGTGACFRVLHAGPLSGRYEDDKWPADIAVKNLRLELAGQPVAPPPAGAVADGSPAVFRLPTGDVIRAWVDQGTGMLAVESAGSSLAIFSVSPTMIKVM